MKYYPMSNAVAVCDRVAAYLKENGYDAGYAEDLGIGLGEFTYHKDEQNKHCYMEFCSRFPDPIHFVATICDDDIMEWDDWYDCAFTYGYVGKGQRAYTPEEWEQKIREEVEKKKQ